MYRYVLDINLKTRADRGLTIFDEIGTRGVRYMNTRKNDVDTGSLLFIAYYIRFTDSSSFNVIVISRRNYEKEYLNNILMRQMRRKSIAKWLTKLIPFAFIIFSE